MPGTKTDASKTYSFNIIVFSYLRKLMSSKRQRPEGEGKSDGDELVTVLESRAMEMLLTRIRNKDLESRFVCP